MQYDTIDLLSDMDLEMLERYRQLDEGDWVSPNIMGIRMEIADYTSLTLYQRLFKLRLLEQLVNSGSNYMDNLTRITEEGRKVLAEYEAEAEEGTLP